MKVNLRLPSPQGSKEIWNAITVEILIVSNQSEGVFTNKYKFITEGLAQAERESIRNLKITTSQWILTA